MSDGAADLEKIVTGKICKVHKVVLDDLDRCEQCLLSAPAWNAEMTAEHGKQDFLGRAPKHPLNDAGKYFWWLMIIVGVVILFIVSISNWQKKDDGSYEMLRGDDTRQYRKPLQVPNSRPSPYREWTAPRQGLQRGPDSFRNDSPEIQR